MIFGYFWLYAVTLFEVPSGNLTWLLKMAIYSFVIFPINSMVDLSIVFWDCLPEGRSIPCCG